VRALLKVNAGGADIDLHVGDPEQSKLTMRGADIKGNVCATRANASCHGSRLDGIQDAADRREEIGILHRHPTAGGPAQSKTLRKTGQDFQIAHALFDQRSLFGISNLVAHDKQAREADVCGQVLNSMGCFQGRLAGFDHYQEGVCASCRRSPQMFQPSLAIHEHPF
jgi:hypothetical protein